MRSGVRRDCPRAAVPARRSPRGGVVKENCHLMIDFCQDPATIWRNAVDCGHFLFVYAACGA